MTCAAPDDAVKALRPPVFFKRAPAFREALRMSSAARAGEVLERLVEAEAACKRTGAMPDALCADALFGIARGGESAVSDRAGGCYARPLLTTGKST